MYMLNHLDYFCVALFVISLCMKTNQWTEYIRKLCILWFDGCHKSRGFQLVWCATCDKIQRSHQKKILFKCPIIQWFSVNILRWIGACLRGMTSVSAFVYSATAEFVWECVQCRIVHISCLRIDCGSSVNWNNTNPYRSIIIAYTNTSYHTMHAQHI